MVAAADIVEENAQAFADTYDIPAVYTDYHEMLAQEQPEMVSVCTWPHLHEKMVIDAAQAGAKCLYCEKPMAVTIGGARRMVQVCEDHGINLSFNHQRRYGKSFGGAKKLLDDGVIGDLVRIEWGAGNLYDYGSHNFDMANYFNDECPGEWAMCQIDYRQEQLWFGAHNENDALALVRYRNGVYQLAITGAGSDSIGCHHRLVGTGGVIDLGGPRGALAYCTLGGEWTEVDTEGEGMHGQSYIHRAIADAVQCYREGRASMMNMHNALNATEQIFACWESVRQRARVDIPIEAEDNPLAAMVASGDLKPAPEEA